MQNFLNFRDFAQLRAEYGTFHCYKWREQVARIYPFI